MKNNEANLEKKWSVDGFCQFLSRTNSWKIRSEWFERHVAHSMNIESMLCVGFGTGFDLTLAARIPTLTYLTAIEPDEILFQSASAKTVFDELRARQVTCDMQQVGFEQFVPKRQYDLVLMSHVLTHIADRLTALRRVLGMLSEQNSFVLIFHQTEDGIHRLRKLFGTQMHESYGWYDLKSDLGKANLIHTTTLLNTMVDIDAPTRPLCDFLLKETCSDDTFYRLLTELHNLGTLLYHPDALTIIYRVLNDKTSHAVPIEILRRKLLDYADDKIMSADDLTEIGRTLYGQPLAASIYGRTPIELEKHDFRISARMCDKEIYDPFAIPIASYVSNIIKQQFSSIKSVIVVDPFLGSGNQLYHLSNAIQSSAAFGFDMNPTVIERTTANFIKLNFDATCVCDNYANISNIVKLPRDDQLLLVIHLSPPRPSTFSYFTSLQLNKTLPPIKDLVNLYRNQFFDITHILFVVTIPEKIERHSFNDLLHQTVQLDNTHFINLSAYGTNLGCLLLMAKKEEIVERYQLNLRSDYLAFSEFATRSNMHTLMHKWLLSYLDGSMSNVKRLLCVGSGTADFETMIARSLAPNLNTFHCVECNIHCIQKYFENMHELSDVHDKNLFFKPFEEFHHQIDCNDILYDLIIFSHSLYCMNHQQWMLAKARQSLLAPNGCLVIFHDGGDDLANPQAELQRIFSPELNYYTIRELERDLKEAKINYSMTMLDVIVNIAHEQRTDNLYNFFLKRYANQNEKCRLDAYFDTYANKMMPWPTAVITINNKRNDSIMPTFQEQQ